MLFRSATLVLQAEAEGQKGEQDDALKHLQQALPLIDAQVGPGSLTARQARVVLGEVQARRAGAADDARVAFAMALSPSADKPTAASPTRTWLRARASLGLARLALSHDRAQALKLAREVQTQMAGDAESLRGQQLLQQARQVEARALAQ